MNKPNTPTNKIEPTPSEEPKKESAIQSPAPDPFDPTSLRLGTGFGAATGVKKVLTSIPIRKPDKSWFVRTHPDPSYRLETAVIELKEEREIYLVRPELWSSLATETMFSARLLVTAINRQDVVFFWPVKLPGPDGRMDEWSRSSLEASTRAVKLWVRVQANMSLGAYELWEANGSIADPIWPTATLHELLRIAFRDKLIESPDHPVLRRLRGEV